MRVLGIDFGTSNTVGMLRLPDGRMRPLLFDGSPLLPSAVYLGTDGRMLVGRDAERHARLDPSRFEPNPKRRIDDGHIFLGDRELPVAQVFAEVLRQVATEARRQLGAPPQEVRLTHPARWGESRRGILVEAARGAGLPNPRLFAEPVAAASYFTAVLGAQVPAGRSLAIYDLGGGTFDATVVRRTPTGFDVLAEEGLPDVGGLDFDHAVVEHLGAAYRATHGADWERLINPVDAADRRSRRMLYEDVRGAKEMLSRTTNADIHLPALEVDAHLTRAEFDTLVRPHLDSTVLCLQRAIAAARVQPADLVGIFLVGGSSRIPLAAHLIHTALGVAPTTLEQPETVVVEGALCIGAARPPAGPVSAPPARMPANRPGPRQAPPGPAQPGQVQRPPANHGGRPAAAGSQPGPPGNVNPAMRRGPAQGPPGPQVRQPPPRPMNAPMVGSPPGTGPAGRPVSTPPISGPPMSSSPMSGPPVTGPAGPGPAGHGQVRPVSTPPGPQVSLQRPGPAPGGYRPGPVRPQVHQHRPAPQHQPVPRHQPVPQRAWYTEPTVLATIGVLVVVAVLFVVLVQTAF